MLAVVTAVWVCCVLNNCRLAGSTLSMMPSVVQRTSNFVSSSEVMSVTAPTCIDLGLVSCWMCLTRVSARVVAVMLVLDAVVDVVVTGVGVVNVGPKSWRLVDTVLIGVVTKIKACISTSRVDVLVSQYFV